MSLKTILLKSALVALVGNAVANVVGGVFSDYSQNQLRYDISNLTQKVQLAKKFSNSFGVLLDNLFYEDSTGNWQYQKDSLQAELEIRQTHDRKIFKRMAFYGYFTD
ncbi:hypothetical protein HY212_02915 [Candidatus Pacearchaeota archaeon]|nr:hypothetical protein [Candidatus Pacearchaeota archaeon]